MQDLSFVDRTLCESYRKVCCVSQRVISAVSGQLLAEEIVEDLGLTFEADIDELGCVNSSSASTLIC